MKNGQRHSLARIPLRWMIRECFKSEVGIIFDAHMLMHEVGLDINSITSAPPPLEPAALHLAVPDGNELEGFSLSRIPAAIISGLGSPFRWIWTKLPHLRFRSSPKVVFTLEQPRFISVGEANEELNDALSPIYDQLDKHTYWKVMEWLPCKLLLSPNPSASAAMSSWRLKGSAKSRAPRWTTTSGPTNSCKYPFRNLSPTTNDVIDCVGCQLEPWKGSKGVSSGDAAWRESSQVREDTHFGPWHGRGEEAVLAKDPLCCRRCTTASNEGGMVGGRPSAL